MQKIKSESQIVWKIILLILLTPFTLIQILFKKKKLNELFRPFKELITFALEPKFTFSIILITIISSFYAWISPEEVLINLMNFPKDLLILERWFALISSGFIHQDFAHLFGNMFAAFIFGRVVERKFKSFKTALIYFGALLISSIGDSLIGLLTSSTTGSLGASGALMGLVAAAILIDPFYITYELIFPLPIMIVGWISIYLDIAGILNPTADGVGHFAHLFGYLSIALLTFFLDKSEQKKLKKGLLINILSLIAIAVLYAAISGKFI